jgi:hypothetical protein
VNLLGTFFAMALVTSPASASIAIDLVTGLVAIAEFHLYRAVEKSNSTQKSPYFKRCVCIQAVMAASILVGTASGASSIGQVSAQPPSVQVGVPASVVIAAAIVDPMAIQTGVNLLRVDATGKAIKTLGALHDDGKDGDADGDAAAADKTFPIRVTLNEPTAGQAFPHLGCV